MTFTELKTKNLLSLKSDSLVYTFLSKFEYPWQALPYIGEFVLNLQTELPEDDYYELSPGVFVSHSAKLYPNICLLAPTVICRDVEVRPGAFIRGNVFVGPGSVVGNSTEIKNSLLIEKVQAPHYNYIGDSILSRGSHLGAGVITSNLRADGKEVFVRTATDKIATSLRKFGAIVAEDVEVGCNAVLNPGSVIGASSRIYPLTAVRGFVPSAMIHKTNGDIVPLTADTD